MEAYAVSVFGEALEQARVLVGWLESPESMDVTHVDLERRIEVDGREILRLMLQGHLDERARREVAVAGVVDAAAVAHQRIERGHHRRLGSVFGPVTVARLAYRAPGVPNVYPADAVLNLPPGLYSYQLRRRMVEQVVARSFQAAAEVVAGGCGVRVGKRQVQELTVAAAVDVAAFYAARQVPAADDTAVLVLTLDGKGVVVLPQALRARTAAAAGPKTSKLATRLAPGEKHGRKRMAQVGVVYHCQPAARTAADIIADPADDPARTPPRRPGPKAAGKWLTASVVHGIPAAVTAVFDEALRRDPSHRRDWVVLVDGNLQQLEQISRESAHRSLPVTIVIDFVHVLEYLWKAAHGFHPAGDQAAETWVAAKAHQVLSGQTKQVITAIRAEADQQALTGASRKNITTTVTYLTNKLPFLDYPTALAKGWPIATGVIEGACRYLVKDRMDITGARWGLTTAEAVLTLRAVTTSGDLDNYWTYHLQQEHQRNHAARYLSATIPT